MSTTHHFEVHGPGRDWDYTVFCEDCNDDAITCANEWLAEVFDGTDVGDEATVTIKVIDGPAQVECSGDTCKLAAKPAPHVVIAQPFGLHCRHCGDTLPISLPCAVDDLGRIERRYRSRHLDCPAPVAPSGGAS